MPAGIVTEACRIAREKEIRVVVDAGPAQDFPLEEIQGLTILSPNEAEARAMCGIAADTDQRAVEAARILRQRSEARFVVLKLGGRGALLYSDGQAEFFPALEVEAVDATAAGDAFTAAMTVEYLRHGDIRRAVQTANIAGAIAVTRLGAQPSLPTKEEITGIVEKQQRTCEITDWRSYVCR
jgi:ribokinase